MDSQNTGIYSRFKTRRFIVYTVQNVTYDVTSKIKRTTLKASRYHCTAPASQTHDTTHVEGM